MTRQTLSILKSPEVIAINQDPLGVAGDLVWKQGPQEVMLCSSSTTLYCLPTTGTFSFQEAAFPLNHHQQTKNIHA